MPGAVDDGEGPPSTSGLEKTDCRRCMGLLYFSQRRYDALKPPICAGYRSKLPEEEDSATAETDSVPGGDFRYVCVGVSAYDLELLRRTAVGRVSASDSVPLPQCVGVEVIAAAALQDKPGLMTQGAGVQRESEPSASAPDTTPERQRAGRSFVPGMPDLDRDFDLERFWERFQRVSHRMVEKMGSNVTYMGTMTRRSIAQIIKDISGGDERGR